MKITGIDCHILLDPGYDADATSSNQDDIVVEVHTDEGITGIGETDLNAWVARACIEAPGHAHDGPRPRPDADRHGSARPGRGLGPALRRHGDDRPPRRARARARCASTWRCGTSAARPPACRRGSCSASAPATAFRPYASLLPRAAGRLGRVQPDARRPGDVGAGARVHGGQARDPDHRALRATRGSTIPDDRHDRDDRRRARARSARTSRSWSTSRYALGRRSSDALAVIESWADLDVFFVETPLWADDLEGYAELARRSPTKIAAGEWLATRFEFPT